MDAAYEAELVLGEGPWADLLAWSAPSTPLLHGATVRTLPDGRSEAVCRLSLARHRYLRDHQLDGVPVLPAMMALELIAELDGGSNVAIAPTARAALIAVLEPLPAAVVRALLADVALFGPSAEVVRQRTGSA